MRILVVGTTPPPGGAAARALGACAADLVAQGHEVEICSPDLRSAAHRHSRLSGLVLAFQLARFSRRFDGVVLRIEPGVPLASNTGRVARAVILLASGAALRLFKEVTLRVDTPVPLPGGLGGRSTRELWARASNIIAASEEDAKYLRELPGVDGDRVVVEEPKPVPIRAHFAGWDIDPAGNLREEILTQVRARAARDRVVREAHDAIVGPEMTTLSASGLVGARPSNPSFAGIARFGLEKARRIAKKVLSSPPR